MTVRLTTRTKIGLARLAQWPIAQAFALAGRAPVVRARRGGITWELDLAEGIDFSIWLLGAFERRTVRAYSRHVRLGMAVLDIGANIGAHTLPLARLVGRTGRVVAFEPTDWANEKLLRNIALNPELAPAILCRQTMLVADPTAAIPEALPASWPVAGGADVHPKLRSRGKAMRAATAMQLDDALESLNIERIGLIKLDVDGYESAVLWGARRTVRRCRPLIITELSPYILAERGSSAIELIGVLAENGYRLSDLETEQPLTGAAPDLAASIPDGGGINVLCRPD